MRQAGSSAGWMNLRAGWRYPPCPIQSFSANSARPSGGCTSEVVVTRLELKRRFKVDQRRWQTFAADVICPLEPEERRAIYLGLKKFLMEQG